jgi:hypothetical protein
MEPQRIQRKRAKGWKMPENTVYVGRPTKWGNPFRADVKRVDPHNGYLNSDEAVEAFRSWIQARDGDAERAGRSHGNGPTSARIKAELRGKNLACFCPLDQPCHADVLLEIANR